MKTKIVTWLGNGEERVDFEGDTVRVTVDDDSVVDDDMGRGIHIQGIHLLHDHLHIVVGPVGAEFGIIEVTPHGIGLMLMLVKVPGPSHNTGNRPVYSANVPFGEKPKLVRYV